MKRRGEKNEDSDVAHFGFGFGYIILDPDTGDGAYKISRGANGGQLVFAGIGFTWMSIFALSSVVVGPVFAGVLALIGINLFIAGVALFQGNLSTCSTAIANVVGLISIFIGRLNSSTIRAALVYGIGIEMFSGNAIGNNVEWRNMSIMVH